MALAFADGWLAVILGTHRQFLLCLACLLFGAGCGTAVQRNGTEQLLLSDSVDRAVDQLDLSSLAGRKVYLDTEYMKPVKGNLFINAEYINSALRQKMTTSGCLIQTERETADYVLEARVGALASDSMEVTYGIPSSGGVGTAASALAGAPGFSIPEISFGKRNANLAVSKVVVFAYHRETGLPVWQSGNAVAKSDAQDSWFLGVGPLTRGSIYDGYRIAGNRVKVPFSGSKKRPEPRSLTIADNHHFVHPAVLEKQLADARELESRASDDGVQNASHEQSPEGSPPAVTPAAGTATVTPAAAVAPAGSAARVEK